LKETEEPMKPHTERCNCPEKRAKRLKADRELSPRHLQNKYLGAGTHPDFTRTSWQDLLKGGATFQTYWSWVYEQLHTEELVNGL
jgi:hypothetical protein